ncbi:MAG: hypothetical protein IJ593_05700 [Lachnospiraceae bacterium]|nr:hypothetical protein [Lachnospiraceae bacterium]
MKKIILYCALIFTLLVIVSCGPTRDRHLTKETKCVICGKYTECYRLKYNSKNGDWVCSLKCEKIARNLYKGLKDFIE